MVDLIVFIVPFVTYSVPPELINAEPVFTSTPILTINQGQLYSYSVTVSDDNSGDTLVISVVTKPVWLSWNGTTISGIPSNSDVGTHNVTLRVNDGTVNVLKLLKDNAV